VSELDEVIEAVRDAWSAMEMYCADLDETDALEDALSTLRSMRERAVEGRCTGMGLRDHTLVYTGTDREDIPSRCILIPEPPEVG